MIDWRNYIEQNPEVLSGKPVIKGTRLSVKFIFGLIAAGWTNQEILQNYPKLQSEHSQAAAAFVFDRLADKEVKDNVLTARRVRTVQELAGSLKPSRRRSAPDISKRAFARASIERDKRILKQRRLEN